MTIGGYLVRLAGPILLNQRTLPLGVRNRLLRLAGVNFRGSYIGKGAKFTGTDLRVGDHTFFNDGVYVEAKAPVTIGKNVSFGPQVMILTTTHEMGPATFRAGNPPTAMPVTISDGVWVGARATILPGVTIGPGAVVAAGAVVATDLPANAIYGGVPAKLIRTLDEDAPVSAT